MTFDLYADDGSSFHCNVRAWSFLLQSAEDAGWDPRGTLPPVDWESTDHDHPWSGTYFTNDAQRVSDEDAYAIAAAIDCLGDALTEDLEAEGLIDRHYDELTAMFAEGRAVQAVVEEATARYRREVSIEREDAARGRRLLRRFRDFCRGGGFVIH